MELTIRKLKIDYDALLHREYDCMAIKVNSERCSKKAVIDLIQEGINIHVCLQHSKVLANKRSNKKVTYKSSPSESVLICEVFAQI